MPNYPGSFVGQVVKFGSRVVEKLDDKGRPKAVQVLGYVRWDGKAWHKYERPE